MNAELITFETKCSDFRAFRATFEGDIEGFRPVKVLVATTVSQKFTYPYSLYTIILQAQTEADIDFMLEELDRLGHDL